MRPPERSACVLTSNRQAAELFASLEAIRHRADAMEDALRDMLVADAQYMAGGVKQRLDELLAQEWWTEFDMYELRALAIRADIERKEAAK